MNRAGAGADEIDRLWIDPADPNNVLASIERLGIFRTTDGRVWDEFNRGLPFPFTRPVSAAKLAYDTSPTSNKLYLVMHHPLHSHLAVSRLFVLDGHENWRDMRARIPNRFAFKSLLVDISKQKLQLWSDQTVLEAPLPR